MSDPIRVEKVIDSHLLSASAQSGGVLPFLHLTIWPTLSDGQSGAVECRCLWDTGSTGFLMDREFFWRHFPGAPTEKTQTTLRYASGPVKTSVDTMARMSFQVQGGSNPLTFDQTFFIIPQLAFDVYLGEGFLRSKDLVCVNHNTIYTSHNGAIHRECLRKLLDSLEGIQKSKLLPKTAITVQHCDQHST